MKCVVFFLTAVLSAATTSSQQRALASAQASGVGHAPVAGEFLVRFTSAPGDLSSYGVTSVTPIGEKIFKVEFSQELSLAEAKDRLGDLVDLVEPNVVVVQEVTSTARFALEGSVPPPMGLANSSSRPGYLSAINADPVQILVRDMTATKQLVAVVDTGIDARNTDFTGKINAELSWSCVDSSPLTDQAGHGTAVATVIDSVAPKGVEFVSLKVLGRGPDGVTYGSLDCLIRAVTILAQWNRGAIVNLSLQNYPPSEILRATMEDTQKSFFVTIAGNYGVQPVTYPGRYASRLKNAICVASEELVRKISPYSNWGSDAETAAFGTLSDTSWGTSYAAPQVVGTLALLRQFGSFSPALLKKMLLVGGHFEPLLKGLVGDPTKFEARGLDAWGALSALRRLKELRLNFPADVFSGDKLHIVTSEDPSWLGQFWLDGSIPQFQLTDQDGNVTVTAAKWDGSSFSLSSPAKAGDYRVKLLVEGTTFGHELALRVSDRRPPAPSEVSAKVDGTFTVFIQANKSGTAILSKVWIQVDTDVWWELQTETPRISKLYPGWYEVDIHLTSKDFESPLPTLASAWYSLAIQVDDGEPVSLFLRVEPGEE